MKEETSTLSKIGKVLVSFRNYNYKFESVLLDNHYTYIARGWSHPVSVLGLDIFWFCLILVLLQYLSFSCETHKGETSLLVEQWFVDQRANLPKRVYSFEVLCRDITAL